jgi:hypothetical protein
LACSCTLRRLDLAHEELSHHDPARNEPLGHELLDPATDSRAFPREDVGREKLGDRISHRRAVGVVHEVVNRAFVSNGEKQVDHRVGVQPVPIGRVDLDRELVGRQCGQNLALPGGGVLDLAPIVVRPRTQNRVIKALSVRHGVYRTGHWVALHGHLEVVDSVEAEQQQRRYDKHQDSGAYRARTPEALPQV